MTCDFVAWPSVTCDRRGDFRIRYKLSDTAWADTFAKWLSGKNLTNVFISTDAENATLAKIKDRIAGLHCMMYER